MNAKAFVDTNILLYSISKAENEHGKRDISIEILKRNDLGFSLQVFQEFYVNATRKIKHTISSRQASAYIESLCRFPVVDIDLDLMRYAIQCSNRFGFSYWDSAILAAANRLNCNTLISEDLQHGQIVDGIRVTNPYLLYE